MRKHLKNLSILAVLTSLFSPAAVAVAQETTGQPVYSESNKFVYAYTHVDAPKVYWDATAGRFKLQTTYSVRGADDERVEYVLPIDHAVNWVDKGWRGKNPAHLYQVTAEPTAAFLGAPGAVLYAAPQIAGPRNSPIWAGFGADAEIPVDTFRDREFSLNLIAVDGPGKVEYFMTGSTGEVNRRLFSSHDTVYRESLMTPAQHTHNYTTFTKPGKYRMTFQAYARDKAGNPIISKPQVHEWRVGGNDPRKSFTNDFRASYAQSPAVTLPRATQPTLQVVPKPVSSYQSPGDEYYTDFKFNTGNTADSGYLVLTIDGYELAQIPVENGRATTSEMLGDEVANFQAIFIPATGAPTGKWVSQQFSYQRTQSGVEQRLEAGEIAAEKSLNPAPVFPLRAFDLNDEHVDIRITPLAEHPGKYQVSIVARDPQFKGKIRGGFSERKNQSYFDCFLDADLTNGGYERVHDFAYCQNDFFLKLELNPYPSVNASGTQYSERVTITNGFNTTLAVKKTSFTGEFPTITDTEETPGNTSGNGENPDSGAVPGDPQNGNHEGYSPTPGNPVQPGNSGETENPHSGAQGSVGDETPVTLSKGHVDIAALPGKQVAVVLKDDTLQHSSKIRIDRAPEAVTLFVPRGALQTRTPEQGQSRFDFLGAVGDSYYLLPETQDQQLIWPGFSTEELDYDNYPAGVDFRITAQEVPAGGKVVGFSVDPFTEEEQSVTTFFDTTKPGKYLLQTSGPTHRHLNWIFTKPGLYLLQVQAVSGGKTLGPASLLRFEIDKVKPAEPGSAASSENEKNSELTRPTKENWLNQAAGGNQRSGNTQTLGANQLANNTETAQLAATGLAATGLNAPHPPVAPGNRATSPTAKLATNSAANTAAKSAEKTAAKNTEKPASDLDENQVNSAQPQAVSKQSAAAADTMHGVTALNSRDWTAIGISLAGVLLLLAGLILIVKKQITRG